MVMQGLNVPTQRFQQHLCRLCVMTRLMPILPVQNQTAEENEADHEAQLMQIMLN